MKSAIPLLAVTAMMLAGLPRESALAVDAERRSSGIYPVRLRRVPKPSPPHSDVDQARLAAAQAKRDRKAAKRLATRRS